MPGGLATAQVSPDVLQLGQTAQLWRMSRNAGNVADFFRLPNNCVIELGTRVRI